MTKREEVKKSEYKYIKKKIQPELGKLDLKEWQEACKSFGPLSYNRTTRKMWYEKNEGRIPTAREIVDFVEGWTDRLRADETLDPVRKGAIRETVVDIIRDAQGERGIEKNKLNTVKVAAFKTLVKFADQPGRLEDGPYEGVKEPEKFKRKVQRSRRGRKKEKGAYKAPVVDLIHEFELKGKDRVQLTVQLRNEFLHPYQNVSLKLNLGSGISVTSVEGCSWNPEDNKLVIDYLPAELSVDPLTRDIKVNLSLKENKKKYTVDGKLFYDDTDKGYATSKPLAEESFQV